MTSQPRPARCIWLTDHDMDWLMAAVTHLRMDEHTHVADIVESIVDRARAAPADAAEALTTALDHGLHPYWALIALGMPHKCDGSRTCRASQHIHGCYAERALGYPHTEQA